MVISKVTFPLTWQTESILFLRGRVILELQILWRPWPAEIGRIHQYFSIVVNAKRASSGRKLLLPPESKVITYQEFTLYFFCKMHIP